MLPSVREGRCTSLGGCPRSLNSSPRIQHACRAARPMGRPSAVAPTHSLILQHLPGGLVDDDPSRFRCRSSSVGRLSDLLPPACCPHTHIPCRPTGELVGLDSHDIGRSKDSRGCPACNLFGLRSGDRSGRAGDRDGGCRNGRGCDRPSDVLVLARLHCKEQENSGYGARHAGQMAHQAGDSIFLPHDGSTVHDLVKVGSCWEATSCTPQHSGRHIQSFSRTPLE